ncbi:MAG: hypothetical protein ABGZ35_00940 [Planctomycetaceae bacterium]
MTFIDEPAHTSARYQKKRYCGRLRRTQAGQKGILSQIIAAVVLLSHVSALCGQESTRNLGGVDIVVLVDISASMNGAGEAGNDVHRSRWDAVKLALDLLSAEDFMMVQRFNHACPPDFSTTDKGEPTSYNYVEMLRMRQNFLGPGVTPLPGPDIRFPSDFSLVGRNRQTLAESISLFNRTDDKGWLDIGGTRIVSALQRIPSLLKDTSVRKRHVILLTDGLDMDYAAYKTEASLLRALSGFAQIDADGNGRLPIHVMALNLQGEGATRAAEAKSLLSNIAHLSRGSYNSITDSEKLTMTFVDFIRQVKGLWKEEFLFTPTSTGNAFPAKSQVVNGIQDLGILSFESLSAELAKSPKEMMRPPDHPIQRQWSLPPGIKIGDPEERTGKSGSLYQYFYYGPTLTEQNRLGSSPFAKLRVPAILRLTMHGSDVKQRLILLKSTTDLRFVLERPSTDETLYRHEVLPVTVRMNLSDHFEPEHFSISATISPVGTSSAEPAEQLTQRGHLYTRNKSMLTLPRTAPSTDTDLYQIVVSAKGKENPAHALSGNDVNLPSRVFKVTNKLKLKPLRDLTLTNNQRSASLVVETAYPVEGNIEIVVDFQPPRTLDKDSVESGLDVDFSTGDPKKGILVLTKGRGEITVSLNDNAPTPGVDYLPGLLTLDVVDESIPMEDGLEKRTAELRLLLGVGSIAFDPKPGELTATESKVNSEDIHVRLVPADQQGFESQKVDVKLIQVLPDGSSAEIHSPPIKQESDEDGITDDDSRTDGNDDETGDKASREDAAQEPEDNFDPLTMFTSDEIWLTDSTGQAGNKLSGLKLDEPFRIHLHAGEKTRGRYGFVVRATGAGVAATEIRFFVSVNAPEIKIATEEVTLYTYPGGECFVDVEAWLSTGLKDVQYAAYVDRAGEGLIRFLTPGGESADLNLDCPHESDRASIFIGEQHKRPLLLRIRVPSETPCGRYSAKLAIIGDDVTGADLKLNVVINRLEIDVAATDPETGKRIWRNSAAGKSIQLENHTITHWLRIRNGLNEPFEDVDEIVIEQDGPFRDSDGDAQDQLPDIEKSLYRDGKSIRLKVLFHPSAVFNNDGRPYRISVVVRDRHQPHRVPESRYTFDVHYFKVRDLISGTTGTDDEPSLPKR